MQRVVGQIVVFPVDVTVRRMDAGRRRRLRVRSRRGRSGIGGTGSMAEAWSQGEPEVGARWGINAGAWRLTGD